MIGPDLSRIGEICSVERSARSPLIFRESSGGCPGYFKLEILLTIWLTSLLRWSDGSCVSL